MFGKLKELAGNSAAQKVIDMIAPGLKDKLLSTLEDASPSAIANDDNFDSKVIEPVKLSIVAASGGVTKMLPGFDAKFKIAMLHLRDELLVLDGEAVALVNDFDKKLPDVLKSGFDKAKKAA